MACGIWKGATPLACSTLPSFFLFPSLSSGFCSIFSATSTIVVSLSRGHLKTAHRVAGEHGTHDQRLPIMVQSFFTR